MRSQTIGALFVALSGLGFSASGFAQDTLVYCPESSPEGFDPALYTSGTTFDASSRQIYNRLVAFEQGTTVIKPALAESYTISDDGLEYTFKLREGVEFHTTEYFTPTREFNATDVVFSFDRQRLAENPYHEVSGGSWEHFSGMSMPDLIESIEALDDFTVKFTLTRPESPMIANLAMDFASILSAEYASLLLEAGTPEKLNQQPVGTGPFKFVTYEQDTLIRYQAHENYWAGKAAIDNLHFAITPDKAVAHQRLKSGECHVLSYLDPEDTALMQAEPDITVLEQPSLNISYLAYNTMVPPFDNVNVRKALNMAINKSAIVEAVYDGMGTVAKNAIPPTVWSYNDAIADTPYDPEKAREMLLAEGVSDLKMKIWLVPVVRQHNPNALRMAELLRQDFALVGVDVEIVEYERGEFLRLSRELDRDGAVLMGWTGDNGDPDNFLAVLLSCDAVGNANRAQWCYTPFDDLIQRAKVVTDPVERSRLYEEAQFIFKEQAPWATIAHSLVFKAIRNEVHDFVIDPFGGHIFYGVSLK